jgi:hypothetical protein
MESVCYYQLYFGVQSCHTPAKLYPYIWIQLVLAQGSESSRLFRQRYLSHRSSAIGYLFWFKALQTRLNLHKLLISNNERTTQNGPLGKREMMSKRGIVFTCT